MKSVVLLKWGCLCIGKGQLFEQKFPMSLVVFLHGAGRCNTGLGDLCVLVKQQMEKPAGKLWCRKNDTEDQVKQVTLRSFALILRDDNPMVSCGSGSPGTGFCIQSFLPLNFYLEEVRFFE